VAAAQQPQPDRAAAQYQQVAPDYDHRTRWLRRYRHRAVERLQLTGGATVIDAACGTGVNFPDLQQRIGPEGRIIGIDVSPGMLKLARHRVREHGWRNVTLIEAAIEDAPIGGEADAALFSFTTDVLASPHAIGNVLAHVTAAGCAAADGFRSPAPWLTPAARWLGRSYATRFDVFHRPWQHLGRRLDDMHIETCALGTVYIASGHPRRPT
jgi:ubiquinone/menaquinone biosynthesis C-methylase UbiE